MTLQKTFTVKQDDIEIRTVIVRLFIEFLYEGKLSQKNTISKKDDIFRKCNYDLKSIKNITRSINGPLHIIKEKAKDFSFTLKHFTEYGFCKWITLIRECTDKGDYKFKWSNQYSIRKSETRGSLPTHRFLSKDLVLHLVSKETGIFNEIEFDFKKIEDFYLKEI